MHSFRQYFNIIYILHLLCVCFFNISIFTRYRLCDTSGFLQRIARTLLQFHVLLRACWTPATRSVIPSVHLRWSAGATWSFTAHNVSHEHLPHFSVDADIVLFEEDQVIPLARCQMVEDLSCFVCQSNFPKMLNWFIDLLSIKIFFNGGSQWCLFLAFSLIKSGVKDYKRK